jgi:allantoin racemase
MIVIINPNSTASMTEEMVKTGRAVCPGEEIEGWTSHDGPAAIQGPEDGEVCIPPLLKLIKNASKNGASRIIIGCFDDTGLDEARDIAKCPVIGIGQAAYYLAAMTGAKFSVVTTLAVSIPVLEGNIRAYGLGQKLGRVRASGVPVLQLKREREASIRRILDEALISVTEDKVQNIVLGCAGMSPVVQAAGAGFPVRLIDGVEAAVQIATIL